MLGITPVASAQDSTPDPDPTTTTTTVVGTDPDTTTTTTAPETTTSTSTVETMAAPETTTTEASTTTAAPDTTTQAPTTTQAATAAVPLVKNGVAELTKDAVVPGGGTVKPGMTFTYRFYIACSSITVDCVGFTFTDTIPAGLEIVDVPGSDSNRDVNVSGNTVTMTFKQVTDNPAGIGWNAGSNEAFDIIVRLPADTTHVTGDKITNTATVKVDGQTDLTDPAEVTVEIPVVVTPNPSKTWLGGPVHAGSGAVTTATIGAANGSPSALAVTSLGVTDVTQTTWERFDLNAAPVLKTMPPGATQAQLQLCTKPNSACAVDADWETAGTLTATQLNQSFGLNGIVLGDVTGVRVVFTGPLTGPTSSEGTVDLDLKLRSTVRGTATPVPTGTVSNCVTSTASVTAGQPVTSGTACAPMQVWPSNVTFTSTKAWVADTNGNFTKDANEYAVAGAESGVTAQVRATNTSPFPITEMKITEPDPSSTTDFDKFDVDKIRLTYPNGATAARVQVTYAAPTPATDNTYTSADPTTITITGATKVTSVTVTYTGGSTADPKIAANAVAGLDLHGKLTSDVDEAITLHNCALVSTTGGTSAGAAVDQKPCGELPVEAPRYAGTGTKTASQSSIPFDQPVTFPITFTNSGNLALTNPVVTDPDPSLAINPFTQIQLLSATASTNQPASPALTLTMEVNCAGTWTAYTSGGALPVGCDPIGVRVNGAGQLDPGRNISLTLRVQRRASVTDTTSIVNCFSASASNAVGLTVSGDNCETVTANAAGGAATILKSITPATRPEWTPGLPAQPAEVELRIANTGNLSAKALQITDDDVTADTSDVDRDFFNSVDFASFGTVRAPSGANQLLIEAWLGGSWQQVFAGAVSTTPSTPSPTYPGSYTAADVRGLRYTFTSTDITTNGGFVMAPCAAGVANGSSCSGIVKFNVTTRQHPLDDPTAKVPTPLTDTASGAYTTNVDGGVLKPTNESPATITLVPGDPKIDVDKAPNTSTMGPGQLLEQTLTMTNNGTTSLTNPSIVDALPEKLAFDETFNDGIAPYQVAVSGLPEGYPAPPAPTFQVVRDGDRVESVRWTFGDSTTPWVMPVGATITITIRVGLAPGVTSGQVLTNTMGATGTSGNPGKDLACTSPDGLAEDSEMFGDGIYCTDTANTTVRAGAAFQARKWVAGKADLGWWHPTLGFVPTGDSDCPSMTVGTKQYTATPCVALVERGGTFDYVLRVVNAGTESATRMALVDNLPYEGDTGLIGGADRGTEWNNRPTLAGEATYTGPGSEDLGYSSGAVGGWCTDDLYLATAGCDPSDWSATAGASTTALRLLVDFGEAGLEPGDGIELAFTMNVPSSLEQESDVTIAWNSFAHAEETIDANQVPRILPPIEPIKVGVSPFLPGKVSVGDYVWVDTNRDGRQDEGEPGIKDVTLTIKGPDGEDVYDIFGDLVGPTTTDSDGKYTFENLPILEEGQSYTVYIDEDSPALAPYVPTVPGVGDREGDSSTGSASSQGLTEDGDRDPTLDFGFVLPKVSVGDYVWVDTNRDGRQDAGELGIPGVTLTIKGPNGEDVVDVFGNPVGPTTTDSSGKYTFENLPVLKAGESYTVYIDSTSPPLAPYIPTIPGVGNREGDSSTGSASSQGLTEDGDRDPTLDFGFVLPKVSVGDFVWVDTNRDGRQDPGEPGIPGVRLTITGPDGGPVTDVYGNPVGPTTTDGNGKYLFENLPALPAGQSYTVHIDPTSPALEPYVPTTPGVGDRAGDSSTDSASSTDLTVDGAHDPTLDFGFVTPAVQPPSAPTTTTPNPGTLPSTGLRTTTLVWVAGVLLLAGGLLALTRRRYARTRS